MSGSWIVSGLEMNDGTWGQESPPSAISSQVTQQVFDPPSPLRGQTLSVRASKTSEHGMVCTGAQE